jgi:hypothetical protein
MTAQLLLLPFFGLVMHGTKMLIPLLLTRRGVAKRAVRAWSDSGCRYGRAQREATVRNYSPGESDAQQ